MPLNYLPLTMISPLSATHGQVLTFNPLTNTWMPSSISR